MVDITKSTTHFAYCWSWSWRLGWCCNWSRNWCCDWSWGRLRPVLHDCLLVLHHSLNWVPMIPVPGGELMRMERWRRRDGSRVWVWMWRRHMHRWLVGLPELLRLGWRLRSLRIFDRWRCVVCRAEPVIRPAHVKCEIQFSEKNLCTFVFC